jgi:hypothetical protein
MTTFDTDLLPPELQRWGWTLSQMTIGSGRDPGGWQFVFQRAHGLANGDDDLDPDDPSLRVEVRRTTVEDALDSAIEAMREASSRLAPNDQYDARYAEFQRSTG